MKRLLIIGHTFPEANTTAAGVRMMQLVHLFLKAEYEIVFCSTAEMTPYSETFDKDAIRWESIRLNDASFDEYENSLFPCRGEFDYSFVSMELADSGMGWPALVEVGFELHVAIFHRENATLSIGSHVLQKAHGVG